MRDVGLGDTPLALGWCGESLCVGFRSQYVLLNPTTGVASEVFPCGRQGAVNILPLPNAELLLTKVRALLQVWCELCEQAVYERRQRLSAQPPVCTFFRPSCVQKPRLTNESEVSFPSNRHISAMCGVWGNSWIHTAGLHGHVRGQ